MPKTIPIVSNNILISNLTNLIVHSMIPWEAFMYNALVVQSFLLTNIYVLYVCIYFTIIKIVQNTNKKNGNVRDYIIK